MHLRLRPGPSHAKHDSPSLSMSSAAAKLERESRLGAMLLGACRAEPFSARKAAGERICARSLGPTKSAAIFIISSK